MFVYYYSKKLLKYNLNKDILVFFVNYLPFQLVIRVSLHLFILIFNVNF